MILKLSTPILGGQLNRAAQTHTYLVEAWLKNDNAKILLWFHANLDDPQNRFDQRIYFFSGASLFLDDYLSASSKGRLNADPEKWRLCYRLLRVPEQSKPDTPLTFMVGTYFATGKTTMAMPFVIDVGSTETNVKLTLDFKGDKKVRRACVVELGVRDLVWQKSFEPGLNEFKIEIPNTNFHRGLESGRVFEGYQLQVEYEDGKISNFSAPEEKTAKGLL